MSDLSMSRKLHEATELAKDIEESDKRRHAIPRKVRASRPVTMPLGFDDGIDNQQKALARGDSDAHGPPQLTTGGGPLPLRTIPMCEFCYMNMRPTDHSQYCVEHDMGGHKGCYQLHQTTVHL